jgi:hypothetical protein
MARTQNPNSANSQFFICFDDAGFLDNQYTVWGEVESGMEYVDALPVGEPPREPGKIVKATVFLSEEGRADHRRVGRARRRVRAAAVEARARLVLVARRKDRLDELAAELGNARAVAIDLSKPRMRGAKLMADLEAAASRSSCWSTMPASA